MRSLRLATAILVALQTVATGPSQCSSLHFDGIDDYVRVPQHYRTSIEFTLSAWIRTDRITSGVQSIVASGENDTTDNFSWFLVITPSGNLGIRIENSANLDISYFTNAFVADGSGAFGLEATWGFAPLTNLYLQWWILDPNSPSGLLASAWKRAAGDPIQIDGQSRWA